MAPVRDLKEVLDARGVDYSTIVEKADLIKLVEDTAHLGSGKVKPHRGSASKIKSSGASSSSEQYQRNTTSMHRRSQGLDNFLKLAEAAEILGVTLDAPDEVIQAAHKALLKAHHPDKQRLNKEDHERKFKDVRAAYETLSGSTHAQRISTMRAAERHHENLRNRRLRASGEVQPEAPQQLEHTQQQQRQQAAMVVQPTMHVARADEQQRRRSSRQRASHDHPQSQQQQQMMMSASPVASYTPGAGGSPIHVNVQVNVQGAPNDELQREVTRAALDQLREASKQSTQFQDILAAAARESASRRAPRPSSMSRDEEGIPPPDPQHVAEQPLFLACEECLLIFAKCYLLGSAVVARSARCILECGGLAKIPDKELEKWGWRDGEQPARFRGALGDRDMAERAMRKRAREMGQSKGAGTMPQPVVV